MSDKMTSQDWKEVEKRLKSFYYIVKLNCDGYKVDLVLEQVSTMKNSIMVYVNGKFKGEWLVNDCEERRRFLRPVLKYVYSAKWRASMKKKPKWLQKEFPDTNKTYTYYTPYWLSFGALKRHLIANNHSIELIREKGECNGSKA
jgi:hypothetical protein